MKTITKIILITATIGGLCLISGCNTMEGVGEDLQQVGGEVEDAAQN